LFINPALKLPQLTIAKFLLKKKLGLRGLLEVIPLDASLVKGSHGRDQVPPGERPVLLGSGEPVANAADVHRAILAAVRGGGNDG
jgi:hypothetical protein